MTSTPANLPRQAAALLQSPGRVSIYESTGGKVVADFAAHNLTLLPPFPSGSIIHDNACGAGTVSRLILSSHPPPPPDVTIHATDIDPVFLDALQTDAQQHAWPIHVSNQRSEQLTFADDYFTHSITNIAIFFTSAAGLDGATEVYRTLRPGGTAVVNCWEALAWLAPFKATHTALRPGVPYPSPRVLWNDGTQIQKVMADAGFAPANTRVERSEAWARTRDLRGWAEKSWAYLGGLGGWQAGDEARWDEAVDLMVEQMLAHPETKTVDGEVWMKASQWIVIATK